MQLHLMCSRRLLITFFQYQFLLRVVAQLKEDGKSINWSRINMPGRTTKSLQNMWTKINKSVSELEEAQDGKSPAKPKKLSTRKYTFHTNKASLIMLTGF